MCISVCVSVCICVCLCVCGAGGGGVFTGPCVYTFVAKLSVHVSFWGVFLSFRCLVRGQGREGWVFYFF